jgi:hypothetical protein
MKARAITYRKELSDDCVWFADFRLDMENWK